jgi:hypothetical protein
MNPSRRLQANPFILICSVVLLMVSTTLFSQSPERLEKDVRTLVSIGPRNTYRPDLLARSIEHIHHKLQGLTSRIADQEFQVDGQTYKNVIASFGSPDGERLIVGAHYDVCGDTPGADDNASGVAGLLELARLLSAMNLKGHSRIDLVFFANEEPPHFGKPTMGSAAHALSLKKENVKVRGMICLEMIGYFTDKPNSQEYPLPIMKIAYPKRGNFIAVAGVTGQGGFTRSVKRAMKEASSLPVECLTAPRWLPGIDFSDHRNYWAEGYKAVMITDSSFYRNRNYHKNSDLPETLDYQRMSLVVKGVLSSTLELSKNK